ncbi:glycosyltransferase family A protein [Bacteroides timonensis]|uniref:glycosyltransferase family A protein n=1 Tax=Bacteroides timonensis TaxID=1470345 RepID=UPI0005C5811A|nr:glycosyltransferase family A protein [Bacteroides timonensis]
MAWYDKYRTAFEYPWQDIPSEVRLEITTKMKSFRAVTDPECSVVLIAHNEERHILGSLWSLVDNICDFSVEILVVSNNSTDATDRLLEETGVCWFREEKKGPGFARQCGLNHARGKYHICIDSDTLYPPYYIAMHVYNLRKPEVVCTYGLWSFLPDEHHPKLGLFLYESLRDIYICLQNINRPELCVRGMVLAFRTEFGKMVGYRTDIIRGEDGMMALELKKYGKLKLIRSRKARAVTSCGTLDGGGSLFRNIWCRFIGVMKGIVYLFTTASEYKDRDSNLIDKNKIEEV